MEKLKLLISDGNREFSDALVRHLRGVYRVQTSFEGQQTLDAILSYQPDLLILDLFLPGMDGVSILQRAAEAGARPMVLVTTCLINDYILDALTRLNVGYLMKKPCEVRATVSRLGDLSQRIRPPMPFHPDSRTAVSNLVLILGIRTKLDGYTYLLDAIPMAARNPGISMTKELYPEVGKIHRVSGAQVEKAIRSAINSAWKMRDDQVWRMYFPPGPDGRVARPTNSVFITRLADCLMSGAEYGEKWLDKESSKWYYMH